MLATTTVHKAAKEGDLDRVVFLCVDHDPQLLNAPNKYGMTPLHFAATRPLPCVQSTFRRRWIARPQQYSADASRSCCRETENFGPFAERVRNMRLADQADEYAQIVARQRLL